MFHPLASLGPWRCCGRFYAPSHISIVLSSSDSVILCLCLNSWQIYPVADWLTVIDHGFEGVWRIRLYIDVEVVLFYVVLDFYDKCARWIILSICCPGKNVTTAEMGDLTVRTYRGRPRPAGYWSVFTRLLSCQVIVGQIPGSSWCVFCFWLMYVYVHLLSFISFVCIGTFSGSVQECPRSSMLCPTIRCGKNTIHLIDLVKVPFGSINESFVFVGQRSWSPCQTLVWFVQEAHMWSNAGCMVEARVVGWADSEDLNEVIDVTSSMSSSKLKNPQLFHAVPTDLSKFYGWGTRTSNCALWYSIQSRSCKPSSFDMEASHVKPVASRGRKGSEKHRSQGRSKARQAT